MDTLTIDKTKTALVVIDLQKGIVSRQTQPHKAAEVIENASKLAQAFRKNSMPVFLTRVATSDDQKDRLHPIADIAWSAPTDQMPADWSQIVPEMAAQPDEIITKKQWGAFYGTELDLQLRRRGMDTIVLCGIATNIGVESTARFAFEYGYQQIFAEDAMAGRNAEEHNFTVKTTFPRMGRVRKTEDVLAALL